MHRTRQEQELPEISRAPTEGPQNTDPPPIAYTSPPVPSGSKLLGGRLPPPPSASESLSPSLSPASWETKGLFIKRIVGGGGGGGGREGGIYKDKKRWEGGKERSCAASRGPGQRWQPGSPGGCMVDPARSVGTRARACACQETGPSRCDAPIHPPQAGNRSSGHGPGPMGGET